jgi:hypothetical protein
MTQAASVTANFGLPTLTLTKVSWAAGNGTISATVVGQKGGKAFTCGTTCTTTDPPKTYAVNASVSITVSLANGSRFGGWGGACASYGTATTCIVTMDRAKTVIANFGTPVPVGVTVLGSGSVTVSTFTGTLGTCSGDCTYEVVAGWDLTAVASPGADYYFLNWDGECAGQLTTTCSLTQVTSTVSALAVFRPNPII